MTLTQSSEATGPPMLFFIGGLSDIDVATNQSVKNTLKYLSEFGYRIHYFSAFPASYRILQNPKKIFNEKVIFHRSPDFLTLIFDFVKILKDALGIPRKKNQKRERLKATQKTQYYDEYNFWGRLVYICFFFIYTPIEMIRVSYYCFKLKPSLFYGINGPGSALATLFGKLFRKPSLQRWHGCSYTEEDIRKIKTRLLDKFLTLDGGFAKALPSDAVVITNDGTQGNKIFPLLGISPEKIHFWMNGMDIEDMILPEGWNPQQFKESLGLSGKKIIMIASRLVLWKRVDRGIDCLYRLVHEQGMKDVTLMILGQGQEFENLQALSKELKVDPYIRFLGAIPHKDIAKYYSIADVFLNLYDVSNLGNPLLEAMSFGLPIASIDDGSTAELLQDGHNAFLVPHEKLETILPAKVKRLLTESSPREEFIKNVKKTFHEKVLSWRDRMLLEHQLIQKLLNADSGPKQEPAREDSVPTRTSIRENSLVSLIVPCRNERKYMRDCLDSILNNDYPQHLLEILVVDGVSEDGTREIIEDYCRRYPFIQFLNNPKKNVSAAMNRGLEKARGRVVFKMDAHATYEKDYVSKCVQSLDESGADNVGGKFVVRPGAETLMAKGIALAMAHPFGVGRYYQWMTGRQAPTEVETVSFGCFKKESLERFGLTFNEDLTRGSDCEFNERLRKAGGKILLIPDIQLDYYSRPTLKEFWNHQFSCGFWSTYGIRFGASMTLRSSLPLILALSLPLCLILWVPFSGWIRPVLFLAGLYGAANLFFSIQTAIRQKNNNYFFIMPLIFLTLHLSRSAGCFCGLMKLIGNQIHFPPLSLQQDKRNMRPHSPLRG